MEYQKLGSTELMASRIGFGCWAIGGHGYGKVDDDESRKAIQSALDAGINFFDTADVYGLGHSEELLGAVIGSKRQDVIIATKFGVAWDENGKTYKDCNPKRITKALDDSLRRLRIGCIPLYQIHWHDGKTPLEDIMEVLQRCREQGKIRYAGCSNFSYEMITEANKIFRLETVQSPFSLIQKESGRDMHGCFDELHMGVLAYGVLARGLLSGNYSPDSRFGEQDTRNRDPNFSAEGYVKHQHVMHELGKMAAAYGKTPSQVATRWVLDNPDVSCALIGIKTVRQALENSETMGWHLAAADWNNLSSL